ncbi:uncharacterized protein [Centruroides vittatus]|uniref:uncharacterized protein n=1 Tax=Centruroides vittatus TaxID=120091 RepID=UPI00350F475F
MFCHIVVGMAKHLLLKLFLCFLFWSPCTAQENWCYSAGGVAGIVIATIIVTLVFSSLSLAAAWYFSKRRKVSAHIVQGGEVVQKIGNKPNFAFDNPYFRNEDDAGYDTPDKAHDGHFSNVPNGKANTGSKGKKAKSSKSNPFTSVFYTTKKQKTMDDSCLTMEPERTVVSLKGHDFTGLGFNICGNMRDGIFVKDVLHRGPASESGQIKAGDRIISVTVSFSNMVYEDALTILSYASPYDVRLELESPRDKSSSIQQQNNAKRLASSSFSGGGHRLFHPLYRSQSIDDLTQIGKDSYPAHGLVPKRSQSMGIAAQKLKSHFEAETIPAKPVPVTGSLNERMLAQVIEDTKRRKELGNGNSESDEMDSIQSLNGKQLGMNDSFRESLKLDAHICSLAGESAAMKRRTPHTPPPNLIQSIVSIETTAQVHQTDDKESTARSAESQNSLQEKCESSKSSLDLTEKKSSLKQKSINDKSQKDAQRGYNSSWNQLERTHCSGRHGESPTILKVQVTSRHPGDTEQTRISRSNGLASTSVHVSGIPSVSRQPERNQKEVIEITERELDDVMMSHRQFLLRKANVTGSPAGLKKPAEFENWNYMEEENRKRISSSPKRGSSGRWKNYETGEYNTRTNDNGYPNTIVIPSGRSSFRVTSRPGTPPPQLESPTSPSIVSHMRL